ncbi:PCC domain-containing protein [Microvirga sp. 17 mud 1-3]|uniref:PCC domain-containing protein n=1 Tax=Microvirga sp. 17 mud 1-3 TaxID=2082949 RepID=UPI000D6B40AB|nr:DUF296 domain-containing protein [Microvirga sp. 17 mud 1-3]AWM86581.1 DUF296 domain-containing protein [Microvirga sp. 17 mud 1-3]
MRQILHPGPIASNRATVVASTPVRLRFRLEPGHTVDEAVSKGFAAAGCEGGFVTFRGGRCEPFKYVMPAASPDDSHAAWYSDTFAPAGPVSFERAGAIVGRRDGRPFLHCHGIWTTQDGVRMGHLLAPDTLIGEPVEASGIGVRTATFEARPDAETNFTLFEPVRTDGAEDKVGARVFLARIRPNVDISLAIEAICREHGIRTAHVHGIGSLNEVRYADGSSVESHATEVLIRHGRVESVDGQPRARLHLDVVDIEGGISSGEIVHGDNPVLVTFELLIEAAELET